MHTSCTVCASRQITFSLRCKKQRRQQLARQLHRLHHLLHSGKQDKTHIIGIGLRCRQHFFSACTTLTLYFVLNKPAHHVHNKVFALPSLHFLLLLVVRCICSPPARAREVFPDISVSSPIHHFCFRIAAFHPLHDLRSA